MCCVFRYKENVRHVSQLMKDQINHPLDRAVYWIEYVIRYQGAPHLRSSARNLALHQRELWDVVLFFAILGILAAYLSFRALCYLWSKFFRRTQLKLAHKLD